MKSTLEKVQERTALTASPHPRIDLITYLPSTRILQGTISEEEHIASRGKDFHKNGTQKQVAILVSSVHKFRASLRLIFCDDFMQLASFDLTSIVFCFTFIF